MAGAEKKTVSAGGGLVAVLVVEPLKHGGKRREPGTALSLPAAEAEQMLADGLVNLAAADKPVTKRARKAVTNQPGDAGGVGDEGGDLDPEGGTGEGGGPAGDGDPTGEEGQAPNAGGGDQGTADTSPQDGQP